MSILITGSSGGLGLDLGKIFLKNNHSVVFHSRNDIDIFSKHNISSKTAYQIHCELSDFQDTKKTMHNLFNTSYKPNTVICNAGRSSFEEKSETKLTSWNIAFNDNFYSALNVINACREIRKSLKKEDNSLLNIICISSICGHENIQGAPIQYSVSKSALNNMVKIYSKELIREGIVLNAISPGNMMFPGSLWENKFRTQKEKNLFLNNIPSNKFVESYEIYETINSLLSSNIKNLVGQVIIVDGGQVNSF